MLAFLIAQERKEAAQLERDREAWLAFVQKGAHFVDFYEKIYKEDFLEPEKEENVRWIARPETKADFDELKQLMKDVGIALPGL